MRDTRSSPPQRGFGRSTSVRCAKLPWASFLILVLISYVLPLVGFQLTTRAHWLIVRLTALVLMSIGLVSGVIALCGVSRHGRPGILTPAVTGLVIWVALVVLALCATASLGSAISP